MSNIDDQDDWSNDSASLFREARQAHDPTLAETARLSAVLKRIQAQNATAAMDATRSAEVVAPALTATSQVLRQVAGVSLGALCIAAAAYAYVHFNRQPAEPARNDKPAAATSASAPPPGAMHPPAAPIDELGALAPAAVRERDDAQSGARSPRRRARASTDKQRTPRVAPPSASDTVSSAPAGDATTLTPPHESAAPNDRPKPASTIKAVTPREPQPTLTAAADKAPVTPPPAAPSELAMMKRMQGALREADFSTALALCAEHARRWPHGVFQLEREGVRAIAACGENTDDAAQRARSFLSAHPQTPVAMRVSAACAAQLKPR